jgi:hypothetical protein
VISNQRIAKVSTIAAKIIAEPNHSSFLAIICIHQAATFH